MGVPDEEMPGTRPSVTESGPVLGLPDLQPDISGYLFEGTLGSGAMGTVFAATDPAGRSVAIKVLHDTNPDDMTRRRFEREVAALQKLEHPGVPQIYEAGQLPDGRLFLVMERLHGITLEDWYEQPGHTRVEALELILDALDALAVAHIRGVVHRDIKPENIFVLDTPDRDRKVKILDFGIALHAAEGEAKRTATGVSVGTPCYMSPEQAARPKLVAAYSDVWSMGVVLYEALCGELPFDGETAHGVVVAICAADHTPLVERSPGTHSELIALVESCLIKARDDRPINAAELKDALAVLLARDEVRATLLGPAATPDLRLPPVSSGAQAFAETEELTEPTHDQLAVAATVSAELASAPAPQRNSLPLVLGALGVLFGIGVTVFAFQGERAPPAVDEAPRVQRLEEPAPQEPLEEPTLEPSIEDVEQPVQPVARVDEVEEPDVEEPDMVARMRRRARPTEPETTVTEAMVDETTTNEAVEPETMQPETMEPVVTAMVAAMVETMQPVATQVQPRMRPPRMRPSMRPRMRDDDRPGFVTF